MARRALADLIAPSLESRAFVRRARDGVRTRERERERESERERERERGIERERERAQFLERERVSVRECVSQTETADRV